jgi:hypothetical protein
MEKAKYSRYYNYVQPVITNPIVKSSAPHIFSILTVIIFLVFVIKPTITTILDLQKSIAENQKVLDGLNKKVEDLTSGKRNLASIPEDKRQKIIAAVPPEANVIALVQAVNQTLGTPSSADASTSAAIASLQLQPVTIIDKSQNSGLTLKEIIYSYNFQKSYAEIMEVLNNTSKSPRLVKIEDVVINRQGEDPPILTVNSKAYFLK